MANPSSDKARIAYVEISAFDDGSVRGGVLVTDIESRPYEFRVTSPIKPTKLQTMLYGKSLIDYMYGELICLPLLQAVKEAITLAVCRDEHLLVARPNLSIPLIVLRKSDHGAAVKGLSSATIFTHESFSGEQAQAEIIINGMSKKFDLFEPFERAKLAVSEVHKQIIN